MYIHYRYTDTVYSKIHPHVASVQEVVSRTLTTVTPEVVRQYQTGLIQGQEEEDEDMYRYLIQIQL